MPFSDTIDASQIVIEAVEHGLIHIVFVKLRVPSCSPSGVPANSPSASEIAPSSEIATASEIASASEITPASEIGTSSSSDRKFVEDGTDTTWWRVGWSADFLIEGGPDRRATLR